MNHSVYFSANNLPVGRGGIYSGKIGEFFSVVDAESPMQQCSDVTGN